MPSSESDRSDHEHEPEDQAEPKKKGRADWTNRPSKERKKRDTHFICLPLVTSDSLPQLARSLEQFRRITTALPRIPPAKAQEQAADETDDDKPEEHASSKDVIEERTKANARATTPPDASKNPMDEPKQPYTSSQTSADLRIVPAGAHRPPGTFHLTLGTMDLSTPTEMTKALSILSSLDLEAMLLAASSSPKPILPGSDSRTQASAEPNNETSPPSTHPDPLRQPSSMTRPISPPSTTSPTPSTRSPQPAPLRITLSGLGAFSSPKNARVLFAHPHDEPEAPVNDTSTSRDESPPRLMKFAEAIRQAFKEAGLVTEARDLTLHATMANMRYANAAKHGKEHGRGGRGGKKGWRDRGTVDARGLVDFFEKGEGDVTTVSAQAQMEGFGDTEGEGGKERIGARDDQGRYIWARGIIVDRVRICKMGATKSDDEVLGMVYPPVGEKLIFGREFVKVF